LVKGSGQGGGFVSCSPKYIIKKRKEGNSNLPEGFRHCRQDLGEARSRIFAGDPLRMMWAIVYRIVELVHLVAGFEMAKKRSRAERDHGGTPEWKAQGPEDGPAPLDLTGPPTLRNGHLRLCKRLGRQPIGARGGC
jgi:hypothetical protein